MSSSRLPERFRAAIAGEGTEDATFGRASDDMHQMRLKAVPKRRVLASFAVRTRWLQTCFYVHLYDYTSVQSRGYLHPMRISEYVV